MPGLYVLGGAGLSMGEYVCVCVWAGSGAVRYEWGLCGENTRAAKKSSGAVEGAGSLEGIGSQRLPAKRAVWR